MTYNIVSTANGGYPYLVGVDVPHAYDTVYPYNVNTWRINGTDNDGYPFTSDKQFPYPLWIDPNINWTFQSDFDIVRDFGRISNNINIIANGFDAVRTNWEYSDKVYKSYIQSFVATLNALIDYTGLNYPKINVPDKFTYVVLYEIELVTLLIYQQGILNVRKLSLYADDVLHLVDWMVE